MSQAARTPEPGRPRPALRLALLGVLGQVGCLTLGIVTVALGVGLWLDSRLATRPMFTLILVLGSVPVTVYLMVRIVLSLAPRLQVSAGPPARALEQEEEPEGGRRSNSGS